MYSSLQAHLRVGATCIALVATACGQAVFGTGVTGARGFQPTQAIAVGNFTGHGYSDVAFLRQDKAVLATTPLMLLSYDSIASNYSVRDLATRRLGNTRNRDGLVLATSSGVFQWDPLGLMPRLDSRVYSRIVTADIDGDLVDDLIGIDDARTTVYTKTFVPQGQPTPLSAILFPSETVFAAATVDWDIDGQRELAIATNQRLWIGNAFTGQSVFSYPMTNASSFLVEFRSRRDELVAWVTQQNGRETLTVVGAGVFEQMTLPWGAPIGRAPTLVVGSVAVGDVDNDGRQDLALSQLNSPSAYLLLNQSGVAGTPSTFGLGSGQCIRVNLGTYHLGNQPNTAQLWFGDMDGDRASEFVIPSVQDGRLVITPAPTLGGPPAKLRPEIVALTCGSEFSTDPTRVGDVIGVNMSLTLSHLVGVPADANGVQLLSYGAVLRNGGELGSEFRTQPVVEIDAITTFAPGSGAPNTFHFRIPVPDGWNGSNIGYYNRAFAGVLRYVRRDTAGDIAQVWPPRYVGLALNNLVYQLPTFPGEPQLRLSSGGGAPTTGYVEPPRLPPKVTTAVVPNPVQ